MNLKQPVIMIVEDELAIREMINFALQTTHYTVVEADHTLQAERIMAQQLPDLLLLDWMLPGKSGIEFTKQLKQNPTTRNIPIILLTAKAEEDNRVKGLEAGADDYIVKPFSPRELIARIKAVLRRGPVVSPEGILQVQGLYLNTHNHTVMIDNQPLKLTPTSYQLLHFFMKHLNRLFSREQLLMHIWPGNLDISDRTVDAQIRRLRKKLAPYGYDRYIETVWSGGYKFAVPHES